jgi:uncharacterized damage-inducible protein DinB
MRKLVAIAVAVLFALPLSAQTANPVSSALRDALQRQAKNLVAAAEEMPEDKYGFHPTPAQMTFGHLVLHVARSNDHICAQISGVAAPKREEAKDTDPKAKLVAALKDSFDFCSSVLAKVDDSKLGEEVTLFGHWKMTRAAAMMELPADWADHYGMSAVYLRLNGLLPPTAKQKE